MKNQSSTSALHTAAIPTTVSKPLQLVAAFLLGAVIVYGAGFTATAHNAAHDMRHSQGFPCH